MFFFVFFSMPEMVEVLSHSGKRTGKLVSKDHAHRRGLWHATVHIWLINNNRQCLLQRRSLEKETFPGLWDVSCAGHVEAGESPIQTACREIHEELGLEIKENSLDHFGRINSETLHSLQYHDREWQDLFLLPFDAGTEFHSNSPEVMDFKWIDLPNLFLELRDRSYLMTPMHREAQIMARKVIG